jgi:hypothetical protein
MPPIEVVGGGLWATPDLPKGGSSVCGWEKMKFSSFSVRGCYKPILNAKFIKNYSMSFQH